MSAVAPKTVSVQRRLSPQPPRDELLVAVTVEIGGGTQQPTVDVAGVDTVRPDDAVGVVTDTLKGDEVTVAVAADPFAGPVAVQVADALPVAHLIFARCLVHQHRRLHIAVVAIGFEDAEQGTRRRAQDHLRTGIAIQVGHLSSPDIPHFPGDPVGIGSGGGRFENTDTPRVDGEQVRRAIQVEVTGLPGDEEA